MEIRDRTEGDVRVVELLGRLDETAAADADRALLERVKAGAPRLLLDLSGVEYVSSSGLGVLLMLNRAVKKQRGALKLCGLNPFVAEVFEVGNFHQLFETHPDLATALAAFRGDECESGLAYDLA
jgi:anti-anti-sigma factor